MVGKIEVVSLIGGIMAAYFSCSCSCCCSIILGILTFFVLNKLIYYCTTKPKSLKGKIVFITGGANGIGRGLALKLAKEGARIAIADIDIKGAIEVAKQIEGEKGEAIAIQCNVSSYESIQKAASTVREKLGNPNILINNAGIARIAMLLDFSIEQIENMFKINLFPHFYAIKEFLPDMIKENEGHIVSIASFAGLFSPPKVVPYSSTKHGIVGLINGLRNELDLLNANVKTTLINPSFVDTQMIAGAADQLGVKPQVLSVDCVVSRIVEAIKYDEEFVNIPKIGNFLMFLNAILSIKAFNTLQRMAS